MAGAEPHDADRTTQERLDLARAMLRIDDKFGVEWKTRGTATPLSTRFAVTCAHVLLGEAHDCGAARDELEEEIRTDATVRAQYRLCVSGASVGVEPRAVWFHPVESVDLALIEFEPVDGVVPLPIVIGHERDLLDDLRDMTFTAVGFPRGITALPNPGLAVDPKAGDGTVTVDDLRLRYLLSRGTDHGDSGGPLVARLGGEPVVLGVFDLGGVKATTSSAWSGDAIAELPGIPDDVRQSFRSLRDCLSDDPLLRVWLRSEVERHRRMPHLFRETFEWDMASVYLRRLVLREPDSTQAPASLRDPATAHARSLARRDLEELIAETPRDRLLVVVGDPGMGKSTLLRHQAFELAGRASDDPVGGAPNIPVFVRVPELARRLGQARAEGADRERELVALVFDALPGRDALAARSILARRALRSRLVLLLDGLDEATVESDGYLHVPDALADLVDRLGVRSVVVSTRPAGFVGPDGLRNRLKELLARGTVAGASAARLEDDATDRVEVAVLEPLTEPQRVELMQKLVAPRLPTPATDHEVRGWLEQSFGDPRSTEFGGNPLWLTLLALLFEPGQPPPPFSELVDRAISALLHGRHNEQPEGQARNRPPVRDVRPIPEAAIPHVRALLRHVAERLIACGEEALPVDALCAIRKEALGIPLDADECQRLARAGVTAADDHPFTVVPNARRVQLAASRESWPAEWSDSHAFWTDVQLKSSLLVSPGADYERSANENDAPEKWRFWHRVFLEALAAEALHERWIADPAPVESVLRDVLSEAARRADRGHLIPKGVLQSVQGVAQEEGRDWQALLDSVRKRLGEAGWRDLCNTSMAQGGGPWIDLERARQGDLVAVKEEDLPGLSAWGEVAVHLGGRLGDASGLAPLVTSLEEGQLARFLGHVRILDRVALRSLLLGLPSDGSRGLALEAASRFLDRANFEAFCEEVQPHFDEVGAWCWFADEGLRTSAAPWAQDARLAFWSKTPDARSLPSPSGLIGEPWGAVDGGTFWMGSPADDAQAYDDEHPQHRVTVSSFRMWRTPVTFEQYRRFDPHHQDDWSTDDRVPQTERQTRPVTKLSWWAAMAFCRWAWFWITEQQRLDGTLPSEAEWEFACRAMRDAPAEKQTAYSFGDGASDLGNHAWYEENSANRVHAVVHPDFPANGFGLHDMHGNVWEWCRDHGYVYASQPANAPASDPEGPTAGALRAVRGGSFWDDARYCRAAFRYGFHTGSRDGNLGFRPVLPAPRAR